jgi:hypothetical protein
MTLKEKFYPYSDNEYSEKWTNAENCEDVADEFAIGFGEWLEKLHWEIYYNTTARELLKIYKKEKGL